MAQWGGGQFMMPHMVTVDKQGHLWTTDVASHTVVKWSAAGKKLLELGVHMEPGHDEGHFCKPTQARAALLLPASMHLSLWAHACSMPSLLLRAHMGALTRQHMQIYGPLRHAILRIKPRSALTNPMCAWAQVALANDGRVYVSDGYCNSRVLEFSAAGEYRGAFALPKGAMRIPHGVVLQARTSTHMPAHAGCCSSDVHSCSARLLGQCALLHWLSVRRAHLVPP